MRERRLFLYKSLAYEMELAIEGSLCVGKVTSAIQVTLFLLLYAIYNLSVKFRLHSGNTLAIQL